MEIATIGFTQSSAERFFERLKAANVKRLLDIRLHNSSQLAGFAKVPDLPYFLGQICGIDYEHDLRLAPTTEMLKAYREGTGDWSNYEKRFLALMRTRNVPYILDSSQFRMKTALLCSEAKPGQCHRRLVAELLAQHWGANVEHI